MNGNDPLAMNLDDEFYEWRFTCFDEFWWLMLVTMMNLEWLWMAMNGYEWLWMVLVLVDTGYSDGQWILDYDSLVMNGDYVRVIHLDYHNDD